MNGKVVPVPNWFPYPIRYIGDCGISGRGYSMRGYLAALRTIGVTEEQIDIMPWPPANPPEDWLHACYLCARDKPSFSGLRRLNVIDVALLAAGRFWTKDWYNIVVASWSTDRLPDDVVSPINRCDEVWAVSEQVQQTLLQAGVEKPIYVIPHALQPELLETPPKEVAPDIAPRVHPNIGPHEYKHTSPVCFYYVGSWDERKNVRDGLLQAYFNTGWTSSDPVELVIHSPAPSGRDVVAHDKLLHEQLDWLRGQQPQPFDAPVVHLSTRPRPYSWICKLHAINHVFVTATRGEGFCLPAWEAAAAGNLVVVPADAVETPPGALTYWSQLTDVPGRPGQKWWDPNLEDLTRQLRVAFQLVRSGSTVAELAHQARARVSPVAVGELLRERLTAIKEG